MTEISKNGKKTLKIAVLLIVLLGGGLLLTTCETPLGLGDPIDTTAPTVFISSPQDNKFITGIVEGQSIKLFGTWSDDINVTKLRFVVYNKNTQKNAGILKQNYKISQDGTWEASLSIAGSEEADCSYIIYVYAIDKFGNEGGNQVNIRIEIFPPWIEDAKIERHPDSNSGNGFQFTTEMNSLDHYIDLKYNLSDAYKNIKYSDIDKFQNESFTLKVEIKNSFSNVKASRLYLIDSEGNRLNSSGIAPNRHKDGDARYPEWDLKTSDLTGLKSAYAQGAHFIQFEILAWSTAEWGDGNDPLTGSPLPDALHRTQRLEDGTVWYQQSDVPKILLNNLSSLGNMISLPPDTLSALSIDFYDDDRIDEIRAGFITKTAFDALRPSGVSEEDYLESLATNQLRRKDAIDALTDAGQGINHFVEQPGAANRLQTINLGTGAPGEYRLIALVKENKKYSGYVFDSTDEKWASYPLVRIQVQSPALPIIIVEKPERENIFPNLSALNGERFDLSGYVLDQAGAKSVLIAWYPHGRTASPGSDEQKDVEDAFTTFAANENAGSPIPNTTGRSINGITVWKVQLGDPQKVSLNNNNYFKSEYSNRFHIVNDFMYNSALQNENKYFYIRAENTVGSFSTSTFRLSGLLTGPEIEVTSHGRGATHDRDTNLVLQMRVTTGSGGVRILDNSPRIYDRDAPGNDYMFTHQTLLSGGIWSRTVESVKIKENYLGDGNGIPDGAARTYMFEARDILGNIRQVDRNIVLSNKPILETITCSNGTGTYGIGTVLRFEATYSMPVRIPDIALAQYPALRLYNINTETGNPSVYKTAAYSSISGNTIVFTYTVADNDEAELLYTSLSSITNAANIRSFNNEQAISTFNDHSNSLQRNVKIALDGKKPQVMRAGFTQTEGSSGHSYYNKGKNITIKLYMSEPVRVSGTPVARISYGTGASEILNASFTSISTDNNTTVLNFTHTLNTDNIPLRQLSLASQKFVAFADGINITDMVGNPIDVSNTINTANSQGNFGTPTQQASIKTTIPGDLSFTLHSLRAGNASQNLIPAATEKVTGEVFIRIADAASGETRYYSTDGGNTRLSYTSFETAPSIKEPDAEYAKRFDALNYKPSTFSITSWRTDIAGNSSLTQDTTRRSLTINSRWPELRDVDFSIPDGSYGTNTTVPIKISFSNLVKISSSSRVNLSFYGTDPAKTTTITTGNLTPYLTEGSTESTLLTVDWDVSKTTLTQTLKNIKLESITFTNITDEYGVTLTAYSGVALEGTGSPVNLNRPIAESSTFQFNRPNFEIHPNRPYVTAANPALIPAVNPGVNSNGGVIPLTSNKGVITFTFDVNVSAVPGKNITIRPYGEWAIPPILSVADFDKVYNADFRDPETGASLSAKRTEYQQRLRDVDANGLPNSGSERGKGKNLYLRNTHGIIAVASDNVRPDTSTKMVLDFETDLYTGEHAKNLREIFNAARWKWQTISVTSSYVKVANNVVTVTLDALDDGRIWEVVMPEGSFQDAAGNQSLALSNYRFWSEKTAQPVIRAEKISYDANNFGTTTAKPNVGSANIGLGFVDSSGTQKTPPVDTRVRIDCETPGAEIRYDLIRTNYSFAVSNPFTSGDNTTAGFFGGTYNGTTGNQNNSIGNLDVASASNRDGDNFFSRLLVPRTIDTGTAALDNGAIKKSSLDDLVTELVKWPSTTTQHYYRSITPATGEEAFNFYTGNRYIYIGEAFDPTTKPSNITADGNGPAVPSSDSHSSLYTGRRDYIVAVAKKQSVTANSHKYSGPALNVSSDGREGVYKTSLLYRNPRRGSGNTNLTRLLIQGFDQPVIPVVAGFPLRDADSTNSDQNSENNYFSKTAYQYKAVTTTTTEYTGNTTVYTTGNFSTTNHYTLNGNVSPGANNTVYQCTITGGNAVAGTTYWLRVTDNNNRRVRIFANENNANNNTNPLTTLGNNLTITVTGFYTLDVSPGASDSIHECTIDGTTYWLRVISNTNRYVRIFGSQTNANGNSNSNLLTTLGSSITITTTTTSTSANHYVWVSWEIVTDWYQKGKGFTATNDGNYLNNNDANANSVAASYGGVIYRYQQAFY